MPTYTKNLLAPSASLPTGVESVAGECRLTAQYPSGFTGDLGFDGAWPPSGWTYAALTGGVTDQVIHQNRIKWNIPASPSGASVNGGVSSRLYQLYTAGDFDLWCRVGEAGQFDAPSLFTTNCPWGIYAMANTDSPGSMAW